MQPARLLRLICHYYFRALASQSALQFRLPWLQMILKREARDPLTPDVGADEFTQSNGIDMQAVSLESPITGKGCYGKEAVKIKIRN